MKWFTSKRERRLWLWLLVIVVAIYSTLGLAGTLAEELIERDLLDSAFFVGFLLLLLAIFGIGLQRRPGRAEVWLLIAAIAVGGMLSVRLGLSAADRTHLFEYGLVAIIAYHALAERRNNGAKVWSPAVIAIVMTALLGLIDEGIQATIPNRFFDLRDVGFNALAGVLSVTAILALEWAQDHAARLRGG